MKIYADNIDITAAVGGLTWQNTISELATKMNFDVAKSDAQHTNIYLPKEGSIVQLHTNSEVYRGIVLAVDDGSKTINKYTICDFGWYLNKSKETYQFNKMPAWKAINKICTDFGIGIDSVPDLSTEITKIYYDKSLSDIIKDILELCGGNYNLDMTPNGIRIYKFGDIYAYPEFRLSPNTQLIFSPLLRGGNSHSTSIEDMKNSVKVISTKDDTYSVLATNQNADLITKYGLLQEVVKIDPEKESATAVAQNKLTELSKIKESFSTEIIEAIDSYTRAGAVISIDNTNYLIEGSNHSIKKGVHYVKLDLRRW